MDKLKKSVKDFCMGILDTTKNLQEAHHAGKSIHTNGAVGTASSTG